MKTVFNTYRDKRSSNPVLNVTCWLVLCLLLVLISGCNIEKSPTQLAIVKDKGVLRVGTLYGPQSYYLDAQGPSGFEFELASSFADYLGVELKMVPSYQLEELFDMLDNGSVDMLAAGLTVTPERQKHYRFSPSYQQITQKLVYRKGNVRPRAIDDLKGTLMVATSTSHVENLIQLKAKHPELKWLESDEFESDDLLVKVIEGEIDYTISDSNILAINRRYYPELGIGFSLNNAEDLGWMIKSGIDDSLWAATIEFFGQVHQNGTVLALNDKYYGHITKFDYVDTRAFIRAIENVLPTYRDMFQRHAGTLDWRYLAAISYQESHWKPKARSHTGVRGMMMLTLPTAKQVGVNNRLDPEQSVRGGSAYLQKLITRIPDRIPYPDRLWFALASYNVGWGHMEDARIITQRQGGDPDRWVDVKKRLPLLKQKKYYKNSRYGYARGDEPVVYVENIRRYYDTLTWFESQKSRELNGILELESNLESELGPFLGPELGPDLEPEAKTGAKTTSTAKGGEN